MRCRPATRFCLSPNSKSDLDSAAAKLGRLDPGRLAKDRSALDYIRVFVGKANVVGVPLGQLAMPSGISRAYFACAPL